MEEEFNEKDLKHINEWLNKSDLIYLKKVKSKSSFFNI